MEAMVLTLTRAQEAIQKVRPSMQVSYHLWDFPRVVENTTGRLIRNDCISGVFMKPITSQESSPGIATDIQFA